MATKLTELKQLVVAQSSQYNATEALRKLNQGLVFIGEHAKNVEFTELARAAVKYSVETVRENPKTAAFTVVASLPGLAPGLFAGPFLGWIGFGTAGIRGGITPIKCHPPRMCMLIGFPGSVASALHAQHAPVVAHGIFATLQSAAAGGYGLPIVQGAVRGAATAVGAGPLAKTLYDKLQLSEAGEDEGKDCPEAAKEGQGCDGGEGGESNGKQGVAGAKNRVEGKSGVGEPKL
ncbi:MAG: hypothetical protein LQ346_001949 [Caloplaca aetnensis]|nr:MAG: hypothetical protein LQ346_001949 [Caloplaca aetnensis]